MDCSRSERIWQTNIAVYAYFAVGKLLLHTQAAAKIYWIPLSGWPIPSLNEEPPGTLAPPSN
jgi:hypothetical protein